MPAVRQAPDLPPAKMAVIFCDMPSSGRLALLWLHAMISHHTGCHAGMPGSRGDYTLCAAVVDVRYMYTSVNRGWLKAARLPVGDCVHVCS